MGTRPATRGQTLRSDALLLRIERLTELPLLILSFVIIPLLVGPFLWDLTPATSATFAALDAFIWAAFAIDLFVKLFVAPNRLRFIRSHWMEVVIVALPFARPFRILRLLLFGSRAFRGARRLSNVDFLLTYGIGLVIIGATIVTTVETGPNSEIVSFQDALWWAIVTVTTVGYGDMVPLTPIGRGVALVLMIGGIGLFGALTANLASFLVRVDAKEETENRQLLAELGRLTAEVERLRQEVQASRSP